MTGNATAERLTPGLPPGQKVRSSRPPSRLIPGLPLTLGYTLFYLSVLVLIPLAGLIYKTAELSWSEFWQTVTDPIVAASFQLTFTASAIAAIVNGIFGLIIAWVLVREPFPGRRFFDALIDFPFALPTAVAGLTFSQLYLADGWIGGFGRHVAGVINWLVGLAGFGPVLAQDALSWLNFPYSTTNTGIVIVLIFVGLPFVVRTVQPVLRDWDPEYEHAALSLGANRWTILRRVIFPEIFPAWLSGLALAFARALGEYGSVIFIAGNIPGKSQIAPLQIVTKLDDFRYAQATAIGVVLLFFSLLILLAINGVQWWARRHENSTAT
ncbi:ABC transporter permease subunit [Methylocapsa sp. D3K7]|uniref:ABC transporter permease n=1 Tax=Methylocapsa sp. D3K7 TaxID=3041435 RepID=UPI00244E735D|nr:ABC transporter permease subunit [Methylocapsa sp. D3K7]WGJ15509.1 ABC transporter permease subunit [Methylocapsa sp. D3K7]